MKTNNKIALYLILIGTIFLLAGFLLGGFNQISFWLL